VLAAVGEAGASFKSLADGRADTTTPHGPLMLTVLGGLAEFERSLSKARSDEGRTRARERGIRFWQEAEVDGASTEGGARAESRGGELGGDWAEL
jgi:DNA invertase Pin-like site-specific DNA recombinase